MKLADQLIIQKLDEIYAAQGRGTAWGAITGILGSQTDLKTALDEKASIAQAAHSGGVIGTANFTALGGSISSLVCDGIIEEIHYHSIGRYVVSFSPEQFDAKYVIVASLGGNSSDEVWSYNIPLAGKTGASFTFEARFKGSLSDDCDHIEVAILRLSQ